MPPRRPEGAGEQFLFVNSTFFVPDGPRGKMTAVSLGLFKVFYIFKQPNVEITNVFPLLQ